MFLGFSFTVLEEEGPHIRALHLPLPPTPPAYLLKLWPPCPPQAYLLGGAGSGEPLFGVIGGDGSAALLGPALLTTSETGAWQKTDPDPAIQENILCGLFWSALSSRGPHLALSPWAARTQAFPCFSQCLTWHSLQQYHSCWHLEQRLEASAPQ